MADSYIKSTEFIKSVAQAMGGGAEDSALSAQSSPMSLVFDEILRRVQEMLGKVEAQQKREA
jgi:hypothetical protein